MAFLFDHWSSREVGTRGCGESSRGVNLLARHLLSPQGCADAGRRYPRLCARPMGGILMSVAQVTEIIAASTVRVEDAVRQGVKRASKTIDGIQAVWVKIGRASWRERVWQYGEI